MIERWVSFGWLRVPPAANSKPVWTQPSSKAPTTLLLLVTTCALCTQPECASALQW